MRDLHALPKAELHIHFEGAVRAQTLRGWADRNGAPVPSGLRDDDGWRFDGPLDFIDQYGRLCSLMTELEDFRRLAVECCQDLAATGVRYAEAVFSPANHAGRFGDDWFGPIEAVLDGLAAGERETGVLVRLCPDVVRDVGLPEADRTLEVALRYADRGVVALNAAGSERAPVAMFAPVFSRAKQAGLRLVPHAGEWAGPQSVWDTLEFYDPDRIGHGVRAIEDPRLVRELADRAIPLEVAPISNVATGVYDSLAEHPFMALRAAGVIVTLNSDDPPMFGAWLADVFERVRDAWGLSDEELAEIARVGVRSSFADDHVKDDLQAGIDAWLAEDPVPGRESPGRAASNSGTR
jgi:adenosine deaminase